MADKIKITPAELKAQSVRMEALEDRMGDVMSKCNAAFQLLCDALSSSFSSNMRGKATKLMGNMEELRRSLHTGADVARECAVTYENADKVLRERIGDELPTEIQIIPPSEQVVQPPVVYNPNGDIPNGPWYEITPFKTNDPGQRSAEAYNEVLADLDVENRARYQPGKDTYCNIYVWDATKAMGCEIPHYYDPNTGAGLSRDYCIKHKGSYLEMSASRMTKWLQTFGAQNGWIECDAATAQKMANAGMPTVAAATTTGHVAMVVPQNEGETAVMISQAGGRNFNHGTIDSGFGKHTSGVKYYYHA